MFVYAPSSAVQNAYRALSLRGFAPLKNAGVIVLAAREHELTYKDVCIAADQVTDGDGRVPASVYHKINAAALLIDAGIPVVDTNVNATTNAIASIANRVVLGTFAGKTRREDIEPVVTTTILGVLAQDGSLGDVLIALKSLEETTRESNAQSGSSESKTKTETTKETEETATEETEETEVEIISPADDILAHLSRALKVVKSLGAIHVDEAREIVSALHALADRVADIPALDDADIA